MVLALMTNMHGTPQREFNWGLRFDVEDPTEECTTYHVETGYRKVTKLVLP